MSGVHSCVFLKPRIYIVSQDAVAFEVQVSGSPEVGGWLCHMRDDAVRRHVKQTSVSVGTVLRSGL